MANDFQRWHCLGSRLKYQLTVGSCVEEVGGLASKSLLSVATINQLNGSDCHKWPMFGQSKVKTFTNRSENEVISV